MNRTTNILTISGLRMLERISYYGMRAIIVLFLVKETGLNINDNVAYNYYGWFTFLIYILPIPLGIISDKILGTKKGILLGGIISLIGYTFLTIQSSLSGVILSCSLIAIGTSLVSPNTSILLGRLYDKHDNKRDLAFLVYYLFTNIGAFASSLLIGYIGEKYNWNFGFAIAALSSLSFLLIFILTKRNFHEIETNELTAINRSVNIRSSFMSIFGFLIFTILFWQVYEQSQLNILNTIDESNDITFINYEFFESTIMGLSSFFSLAIFFVLIIYGAIKGFKKIYLKFAIASILIGTVYFMTLFINQVNSNDVLEYSMVPLFIIGLSEIFISAFSTSFLTRISDINYSATIYGLFFGLVGLASIGLAKITIKYDLEVLSMLAIISGCLILIFRKKLRNLYFEIE